MSILADLFVASAEDARQYAMPDFHQSIKARLIPAEYKGLTTLELGTFWALLEGSAWSPERHDFIDESIEGDDGSWLYRFPKSLVHLLATASETRLAEARTEWAATDEISGTPEGLEPLVSDLRKLAQRAQQAGLSLYLWGCT